MLPYIGSVGISSMSVALWSPEVSMSQFMSNAADIRLEFVFTSGIK